MATGVDFLGGLTNEGVITAEIFQKMVDDMAKSVNPELLIHPYWFEKALKKQDDGVKWNNC